MPRPNEAMREEAQRGLDWRAEHGRGGTEVGVARARDIINNRNLSIETVQRMASYFARHEVDKEAEGFRPGEDGYPSAGRIAWALWSGDPGRAWANRILREEQEKSAASLFVSHLRTLLASESDSTVASFLSDYIVSFDRMATSAGVQTLSDKIFIHPTSQVFTNGDWFQMVGIDAKAVAAKMVKMLARWDRANHEFVSKAMGWDILLASSLADGYEVPVTRAGFSPEPGPAIVLASALIDLGPESLFSSKSGHISDLLGSLPNGNTGAGGQEKGQRMSNDEQEIKQVIEYKDFNFKLDEVDDEGYFTGYASTFDMDSMGDTILPGAFKRTLNSWAAKQRPIPVLWQHKADEPIGATIEAMEDERGLKVRGRLLMGLQRAREAYEAAKAGILGGLSIGFSIPRDGAQRMDDGTREIRELKLYEYSFVTFPANEAAVFTGVKNAQPELAEIRDLLSDIKRELRAASVAAVEPVDEPAPASDDVATLLADIRKYRQQALNSDQGVK